MILEDLEYGTRVIWTHLMDRFNSSFFQKQLPPLTITVDSATSTFLILVFKEEIKNDMRVSKWWLNVYFRVNCPFKTCSLQVREILFVQQKMCASVLSHQNSPVFCNTHRSVSKQSSGRKHTTPQSFSIIKYYWLQLCFFLKEKK